MIGFLELLLGCLFIVILVIGLHEYAYDGDGDDTYTVTYTRTTYEIEYVDGDTEEVEAHQIEQLNNSRRFYIVDDIEYVWRRHGIERTHDVTRVIVEVSLSNVKTIRPIETQEDEWDNVPVEV
jgi:hypothetical protein